MNQQERFDSKNFPSMSGESWLPEVSSVSSPRSSVVTSVVVTSIPPRVWVMVWSIPTRSCQWMIFYTLKKIHNLLYIHSNIIFRNNLKKKKLTANLCMVCISAQSISFLKDNFYERKSNLSGEHSPGLLQYELHFTELKNKCTVHDNC